MHVTATIDELRAWRRGTPAASWGLVPTLGFLHEGHLTLVRRARQENEQVGVSIFVNPTQFGDPADLTRYPRDLERDLSLLRQAGVDLVFTPEAATMYPAGFQTRVHVADLGQRLEGAARPGHFDGVATVVAKLFNLFQPTRAYFGQKDAQQTVVIRRLIDDLNFDLSLVICPTVRASDGLALSSRNARLNEAERQTATVLYRALQSAARHLDEGEIEAAVLRELIARIVADEPLARLDYVSVADPDSLLEQDQVRRPVLLSLAVFVGPVRLIDNILLE